MATDLDDRKLKILNAIVQDYILTSEPIGSRTIERKYGLGISAATIRNEMSDLEDLGLIVAPHASAGRIPSDKGYRLYVDKLVEKNLDFDAQMFSNVLSENINKIDDLMEETAKAIANFTNYTTVVSEDSFGIYKIRRLQLIPIDDKNVLLVMVFDEDVVKYAYLPQNGTLYSLDYLNALTLGLNEHLNEMTIDLITEDLVYDIVRYVEDYNYPNDIIKLVIKEIYEAVHSPTEKKLYKSGVNKILEYPQFYNNVSKAKDIFESIEEKDFLSSLLSHEMTDSFEIVIGEENDQKEMKDFSVVKARYKISEHRYGSIGIIGPKSMNYEQTIAVLNGIVKNIGAVTKSIENS